MTTQVSHFIAVFSSICGITAFVLYFISTPKKHRHISLLISAVCIGFPSLLFILDKNVWYCAILIAVYTFSIAAFSYLYSQAQLKRINHPHDLVLVANRRASGQDWILSNVSQIKHGTISIDAFGVKLDALYKILKGSTYKSQLPPDLKVNMRVLFLEPDSSGAVSRSIIENNDKVLKDVHLMKEVWIKVTREYKRHPNHSLKVRTFNFVPSFYILRVNERMLIGMYLAESGYENLSLHLEKKDGATFNQFERYFDRIWEAHSSALNPKATS